MNKIRAFIAVSLPPIVKISLSTINDKLAAGTPDKAVRWVDPELMHLTLRFLGDTAVSQLTPLAKLLDGVASRHKAFALYLDKLGSFPNFSRPRVIWVGLRGELSRAVELKDAIDQGLIELGWPVEDRPFQPHLTIGRVKDSQKLKGVVWEAKIEPLPIAVSSIHLVQSDLTPQGPIYTILNTSNLAP